MAIRHFTTLLDFSSEELKQLIQRAIELKDLQKRRQPHEFLKNRVLGMVFEKSSTRTRVSFESAMTQAGGGAIFLSPQDTQLGRGEPVEDMARVLSGMVDCIMVRTYAQSTLELFAEYASVPVINALTDLYHPCQLLADVQTYTELRGDISGKTVAWIGDGNNMCHSYINAAARFDFELKISTPGEYRPQPGVIKRAGITVETGLSPQQAVNGADLVVTDTWASMGQEEEHQKRIQAFAGYQVDSDLMAKAKPDAIFMHCLPAHRGEEVSPDVIDGPQSVVWQEAANRLHAQKALLEYLIVKA